MIRYIKVAELQDFSSSRSKRVVVEDTEIALFLTRGQFYAVQNLCPHQHFAHLHEGILNDVEITCPMHGWTFDLSSGKATIGGGRLKCFAVKVAGNDILVETPDPDPEWTLR